MESWLDVTEEPENTHDSTDELLVAYLDFFRASVLRKLEGLTDRQLRTSLLPSGWSPLEMLHHLTHVERRWMQWGFLGQKIELPWGDWAATGPRRWAVPDGRSFDDLRADYINTCNTSREIAAAWSTSTPGANSERFRDPSNPPNLGWILFHLLQEYARHVGQLDVVRELIDGAVGE